MFIKFFKLCGRDNEGKKPLEDFTTEAFASVLKLDRTFLEHFCDSINIPKSNYVISTQIHYKTTDNLDCYIDLVLESKDYICFIENKVNSKEGDSQLSKYQEILQSNFLEKRRFLRYCTKYREEKIINNIDFLQYTWHQVASLAQPPTNSITHSFYTFLKFHGMANNHSLTENKLTTMSGLQDTLITVNHYIEEAQLSFIETFCKTMPKRVSSTSVTARGSNRIGNRIPNIIDEEPNYNEIMYSIDLDEPARLNAHIFLNKNCKDKNSFIESAKPFFKVHESIFGVAIHLNKELGYYIDLEDPTYEIKQWFDNAFQELKDFMITSSSIKWNTEITDNTETNTLT